jgi:hypothetical protein
VYKTIHTIIALKHYHADDHGDGDGNDADDAEEGKWWIEKEECEDVVLSYGVYFGNTVITCPSQEESIEITVISVTHLVSQHMNPFQVYYTNDWMRALKIDNNECYNFLINNELMNCIISSKPCFTANTMCFPVKTSCVHLLLKTFYLSSIH